METNYAPVQKSERVLLLDALRGLAVFGILMVNIHLMYKPMLDVIMKTGLENDTLNSVLRALVRFLFEGKFYIIFSFLFGYGFWLFMNKSVEGGKKIVPIFRRRLFFLLLFGLAHVVFLWAGDILVFYALFGFFLLLFRKSSNKKVYIWAIVFISIPTVLTAISVFFMWLGSQVPEAKELIAQSVEQGLIEQRALYAQTMEAFSNGSYSEIVSARLTEYKTILPAVLFFYPVVLAAFLVGMLFARKKLLKDYKSNKSFFVKAFWWGLGIGIPSNILYVMSFNNINYAYPDSWLLINTLMLLVGGASLGLCYISAITLLFVKEKSNFIKNMFAPVGRMALTNYLSHSIICAILFHSYGFGLYAQVEVWQAILIAIAIFTAQIYLSRWWLNHYLYGPFEWLWRSLTYLKWQTIKINK
jgi:uncharacterized protein